MTDKIGFYIVGAVYIAILFTLVRPNSKGPQIVQNIFSTFTDLVRGVAGQTYDSTSNTWSAGNG